MWLEEQACGTGRFGKRVSGSRKPTACYLLHKDCRMARRGTGWLQRSPCPCSDLVTECAATQKGTELHKSKDTSCFHVCHRFVRNVMLFTHLAPYTEKWAAELLVPCKHRAQFRV